MSITRLIPCLCFATSVWAQLPPSSLNPTRPVDPFVTTKPVVTTTRPVVPAVPVETKPPATIPEMAKETVPVVDVANAIPNTLTPEEKATGWRLLFDGQKLTGLKGMKAGGSLGDGFKIENGEISIPENSKDPDKGSGCDLITTDLYYDFEFRFEWKAITSANSGIRYMMASGIGQAPSGLEYQIVDNVHNTVGLKGGLLRRSASLDNVLPVGPNAVLRVADPLNKIGDPWNEGRIVVQGAHVEHWMNGAKVLEFELGPALRKAAESHGNRVGTTFGMKTKTQLCLLDEGTHVSFRNLKVRPLAAAPVAPPRPVPNPFLTPNR